MRFDEPFFMTNSEWYRKATDEEETETGRGLELTDAAPQEAIDSYWEYYKVEYDEDGRIIEY